MLIRRTGAVVQLPLSVAHAIGGSPVNAPHGAVMWWPLTAVEAGEELTRDMVPGQRSLQRAAMLLSLLSPRYERSKKSVGYRNERWWNLWSPQ